MFYIIIPCAVCSVPYTVCRVSYVVRRAPCDINIDIYHKKL
jgi:hypothetical protein